MKPILPSLLFGGAILVAGGVARADLQEDVVKMLERQARDVDAGKPDCDKMLHALLQHVDADAALNTKLNASDKDKSLEEKQAGRRAFYTKYSTRLEAAWKLTQPVYQCGANPKLKEWRNRFGT